MKKLLSYLSKQDKLGIVKNFGNISRKIRKSMKKLFNKQILKYSVVTFFIVVIGIFAITFLAHASSPPKTETVDVDSVSQQILATGSINAQTQAVLNFQIGGKLIYLPFKEGDAIYQGQTIAQLDSYALQKQLQIAANNLSNLQEHRLLKHKKIKLLVF